MRILLFGPYPLPDQPISGGMMAVVHALARGLAQRPDFQVAVASATAGGEDRVVTEGPITIHHLGIPRFPRARGYRTIRRKLVDVAHRVRPGIIHAHGAAYYANGALDGYWPVVITAHGVFAEEAKRNASRNIKTRLAARYDTRTEAQVLRRARHVIAISPYIRQIFAAYPHLQWTDIPNPVDDSFFGITRQPQPGRLFTPARIIPRKGTDILIRAFAAIAEAFPQATLRIAGETDSAPAFVRQCREIAVAAGVDDRVHFLGNLEKEALLMEYSQAAAVVLPARQETAPVAIEEALAAGCPVIATRVGGVPWMIEHEKTGLLLPPEDAEALADALRRALAQPDQLKIWGEQARRAADQYRLDAVIDKTIALYRQILGQSPDHG
jgi:glycosyltransferase involved in cell wall biosynthesis